MALRTFFIALVLTFASVSCDHANADGNGAHPADPNAVYECPMHCVKPGESGPYTQHGPGHCPVCGMDLVVKTPAH
ncbi:MAG: hypothetical protein IPK60_14145 [Sandaracinaceae bacterium]|nr:hypothetical protein [Sandaracinaceae bacterium]